MGDVHDTVTYGKSLAEVYITLETEIRSVNDLLIGGLMG
jgi:hypothetical protein